MMEEKVWYGAKTIYQVLGLASDGTNDNKLYEERVVILRAASFDDAIDKAEKEAGNYAAEREMKYLGFVSVFKLFDEEIADGAEVYSLMRESELDANAYLDRFYDDGSERTKRSE